MSLEYEGVQSVNGLDKAPLVSWLLCAHVPSEQLRIAVRSCLDQSFDDFELLLVANGDRALEVVDFINTSFPLESKLRIISTPISYLTFSLSLGLHHANGKFIARMDADDIAYPSRLFSQIEYLNQNPEVTVLGSFYDLINENNQVIGSVSLPIENTSIRSIMKYRNPICHPSVMYRRELVMQYGGYLGGLYAEDYDLWVRLSSNPNIVFHNLPKALIGYRTYGSDARGAKLAYASQFGIQLRQYSLGHGISWLLGSLITLVKLKFFSK